MKNIILIGYIKEDKVHILHMVMYENDVTDQDIKLLKEELQQDEEFNWIFNLNENIEAFSAMEKDETFVITGKLNGW